MALKEILAAYTFDISGIEKIEKANKETNALTRSIRVLAGVAGATVVAKLGAGLFGWINATADAADQTDKFAKSLGASARDVAEWDMILGNAGVPLEQTRVALKTFAKQSGEAAAGNKDLQAAFSKLGVRSRDAAGGLRPLNDRLESAVLGLTKIQNPAKRAAMAEKLFGEAGLGFVRVALDGADALAAQRREFDALHGGESYEQFIEDSKEAAIANDRWRNATSALRIVIAGALVPTLTTVVSAITRTTMWLSKALRGTKYVEVALAVLSAVAAGFAIKMAIAFAPALITVGVFAAALAAAVIIIEDIYVLFLGGDSVIGRWIDSWLGVGHAEILVQSVKEAVAGLVPVLKFVVKHIEYFIAAFAAMKLASWAKGLAGVAKGFSDIGKAAFSAGLVASADELGVPLGETGAAGAKSKAGKAGGAAAGAAGTAGAASKVGRFGRIAGGVAVGLPALGVGFSAGTAIGEAFVSSKRENFEREQARNQKRLEDNATVAQAALELVDAGLVNQEGFLDPRFEKDLRAAQASGQELTPLQRAAQAALVGFDRSSDWRTDDNWRDTLIGGTDPERKQIVQSSLDRAFLGPILESAGLSAQAGGGVTINSPTQITVQGTANPEETARFVVERIDQKQQDDLRRARESLGQR